MLSLMAMLPNCWGWELTFSQSEEFIGLKCYNAHPTEWFVFCFGRRVCVPLRLAILSFGVLFIENTKWSHHSFVLENRCPWGWRLQPPCNMRWTICLICLLQLTLHFPSLQNLILVPQRKTPCLHQLNFSSPLQPFLTFQQQRIGVLLHLFGAIDGLYSTPNHHCAMKSTTLDS